MNYKEIGELLRVALGLNDKEVEVAQNVINVEIESLLSKQLGELVKKVEELKTIKTPEEVVRDIGKTYDKFSDNVIKKSRNAIKGYWSTKSFNKALDQVIKLIKGE